MGLYVSGRSSTKLPRYAQYHINSIPTPTLDTYYTVLDVQDAAGMVNLINMYTDASANHCYFIKVFVDGVETVLYDGTSSSDNSPPASLSGSDGTPYAAYRYVNAVCNFCFKSSFKVDMKFTEGTASYIKSAILVNYY